MQRFDHPARPTNPYPEPGTRIEAVRYDSALVLLRLKDAVRLRTGEDADYILAEDFVLSWKPAGEPWRAIVVPAGLVTDLTSVPRLLRWIVGRVGPWLEAAIVHDYLYIAWQDVPGLVPTREMRRFADDLMLEAMLEARVRPWMARAIHWAVSRFGGGTFAEPNEDRYVKLDDPDIAAQRSFNLPPVAERR